MTTPEMLLRLIAGVGLGTVIGFERQYRARMAGLRTNGLTVRGLNTAATLWCSAAVGSLAEASTNLGADGRVEVRAVLTALERDDRQLETAISRLSLEPSVSSVRWQAEEPTVGTGERRA